MGKHYGKEILQDVLSLKKEGVQYTSQGYFNLAKEYSILPSMSRAGTPLDNACAEGFFSILKTECIYRQRIKTFDEARALIDDYIQFYNFERFQTKTQSTPYKTRSNAA